MHSSVNVKLSLCKPWRHIRRWCIVSLSHDLVIRRELSTSRSGRITHGTHCILGWVGTRTGLDVLEKESFVTLAGNRTTIPRSSSPYSSHYTDRAILLLFFYYSFWKCLNPKDSSGNTPLNNAKLLLIRAAVRCVEVSGCRRCKNNFITEMQAGSRSYREMREIVSSAASRSLYTHIYTSLPFPVLHNLLLLRVL